MLENAFASAGICTHKSASGAVSVLRAVTIVKTLNALANLLKNSYEAHNAKTRRLHVVLVHRENSFR